MTIEAMKKTATALKDLLREAQQERAKALSHQDEHLTDEGLNAKRNELAKEVAAKYGPQIDRLESVLDAESATVARLGQGARPKVDAATVDRAWAHVKTRLDQGMPLQTVLANATIEEAIAIRTNAPAMLDAQAYKAHASKGVAAGTYEPFDASPLERAVDQRLSKALRQAGKTAEADLLDASHAAAVVHAGAGPALRHTRNVLAGQATAGGLQAAVDSHYAAAQAGNAAVPTGGEDAA